MKASELAKELLKVPDCEVLIRRFELNENVFDGEMKEAEVTGIWQFSVENKWLELSLKERHS
ncbi:MAG: hypothetical protein BWY02_02984 [bacterium ADurb.Bin157]|nr:MAG: hypothetical protein BWY02_02984 [bacterium ADurb.Bin157]